MNNFPFYRYESLEVINNEELARNMMAEVGALELMEKQERFAHDILAGAIMVHTDPAHPGVVLEVVSGSLKDDVVATLYKPHPIFASAGELIKARREMIEACAKILGQLGKVPIFKDKLRSRVVMVSELPTMILLDGVKNLTNRPEKAIVHGV